MSFIGQRSSRALASSACRRKEVLVFGSSESSQRHDVLYEVHCPRSPELGRDSRRSDCNNVNQLFEADEVVRVARIEFEAIGVSD